MYCYEITTGFKCRGQWAERQETIERGYFYDTRDDARAAAVKRCVELQTPKFLPVYKIIILY